MISVVIPLFNKTQYIERTIFSVLQQTYQNFEIIVVDDESTDGGDRIVERMQAKYPSIQLIRRLNGGQSVARNSGIKAAKGKLVAFLDADDQWEPGFLSSLEQMMHKYPEAGIFATGYRVIYAPDLTVDVTITDEKEGQDQFLLPDYFKRSACYSFVWVSAMAIPTQIFGELGSFLEGEHIGGDTEMIGRVALHYPVAYDRRHLAIYRADAQGRQNPRRDRKIQYPPFTRTYAQAVDEGNLSADAQANGREYINRLWLNYLILIINNRNRAELQRVLKQEISKTNLYHWRILFLKFGSHFLPMSILNFANRLLNSRWASYLRHKQYAPCGVSVISRHSLTNIRPD